MLRRGLLMTHRWLALLAFLPLILVLLSGAALSFVHEFDRAMHPQLLSVAASSQLDIARVSSIIEDDVEKLDADLIGIRYPNSPYDPIRLQLQSETRQWLRYINPHSGKILGERGVSQDWSFRLLKLHTRILSAEFGSLLTLIGTIALLMMLLLGILLLRQAKGWQVKGLHAWLGLCSAPVLLLIIVSGLLSISGAASMHDHNGVKFEVTGSLINVLQSYRGEMLGLCEGHPQTLEAVSNSSAKLRCHNGNRWSLDSVVREQSSDKNIGNEMLLWNIHSGEWAGLPGRAFWMWVVLGVLYLVYSGLRDWLKAQRRRKT